MLLGRKRMPAASACGLTCGGGIGRPVHRHAAAARFLRIVRARHGSGRFCRCSRFRASLQRWADIDDVQAAQPPPVCPGRRRRRRRRPPPFHCLSAAFPCELPPALRLLARVRLSWRRAPAARPVPI